MSTKAQIKTQAKMPAAPGPVHAGQPPLVMPDREAEQPDFAVLLEDAARLGHSLGAIRITSAAPSQIQAQPLIQRQSVPEGEEDEEELQMQRETADIQRQELPEEEQEEELQTKLDIPRVGLEGGPVAPGVEAAIQRASGGGQPLDSAVQAQMEAVLGHDFSTVLAHTDAQADALNQQVGAKAFTTGRDIFFRQGEYNPGSGSGRELIAHEVGHVVQQSTGRALGGDSVIKVEPEGDSFEHEAESVARVSQTQHRATDLGRGDGGGMNIHRKAFTHQALDRSGVIQRKLTFQPEWETEREHKEEKKDAVRAAILRAKVRVRNANVEDRERYRTWFGEPDSRKAKVVDTLRKVSTSLDKDITVHADFDVEAFAYVYQNQPDHIWIAKDFLGAWSNSAVIDSTAGVLIHEVSHYAANTQDVKYGVDECKDLANDEPDQAIKNADSYEYFCESFNW
jgi:hypothetical protein